MRLIDLLVHYMSSTMCLSDVMITCEGAPVSHCREALTVSSSAADHSDEQG